MSKVNNGSAFQVVNANDINTECGMTLLDYLAAKAMQGICVNMGRNGYGSHNSEVIAKDSYLIAKAMLIEREKVLKELQDDN